MTLVYNQSRKGPGTHALIVGVEHPSPIETGEISASLSARAIATKLLSLDFVNAPLASVELIASYSPHAREFLSPRDGISHTPGPPLMEGFRRAVTEWLDRAARDPGSLALFYYAGPVVELYETVILAIPAPGPTPASGADFGNLWTATRALPIARQLFFIDACPTEQVAGRAIPPPLKLLAQAGAEAGYRKRAGKRMQPLPPDEGRARFHARMAPKAAQSSGSQVSFMTAALRSALTTMNRVSLGELARLLQNDVRNRMGSAAFQPDALEYQVEGDVRLSWRDWKDPPSAAAPMAEAKASPPADARRHEPAAETMGEAKASPPADARRHEPAAETTAEAKASPPADARRHEPGPAEEAEEEPERSAGWYRSQRGRWLSSLSQRQRDVLHLVSRQLTSKEIAAQLGLDRAAVDNQIRSAMRTLEVKDRQEAARLLAELLAERARALGETAAAEPAQPKPADGEVAEGEEPERSVGWYREERLRRFRRLSALQWEMLDLVSMGLTSKQIGERLDVGRATVDDEIRAAMRTLQVNDRHEAARLLIAFEAEQVRAGRPPARSEAALAEAAVAAGSEPAEAAVAPEAAGSEAMARRGLAEPEPVAPPERRAPEANTHFVSDDPEVERDELGRGPLAIALGRRLHRIWCRSNGIKVPGDELVEAGGDERSAFVLHLDAPWGGGKTSFANFLARVLNPFPRGGTEAAEFLVERAGGAVGTIFIDDPPAGGGEGGTAAQWPEDARRPWIVVNFNAWQAEHCTPPWWTFYQAIRKGCFAAVWAEGRSAARPAQASGPPRPLVEERIWSWAALWRRELMWRLRTPKVVARLATFAVAALAFLILWRSNVIFRGDEGPDFNAGNALGFLLAGIGGISGLWGLGALFTESVAPGTDDLAERRSLGGGDPFERFRRHFGRTMGAVRRPVMVIVDDLDRCRPDFVVDLVRGIQTLLGSPRVVFVILGDRDWIERAFEAHHAAMSKVNVGPEQEFGARFVEKAIQMSFILPEMPEASQDSYVRRVLIGPGGSAAAADAPAPPEIAQQLRADYREKVAAAPTPEARKQAEGELLEQYRGELEVAATAEAVAAEEPAPAEDIARAAAETAEQQAIKVLSEERALLAAVDERMGQALLHRLEPLARFFPPNPRQIKRIVNAITMYTAVAYLQMDMDESDPRGVELAIWVIIMTEWPKTWRVLASWPQLADLLADRKPEAALARMTEAGLPGSRAAALHEINRIRADRDLFALITEEADDRPRLRSASVEMFARLTPLYSRRQRLTEAGAGEGTGDGRATPTTP